MAAEVVGRQGIVHRQRLLALVEGEFGHLVDELGDGLRTVLDHLAEFLALLGLQLAVLGAKDVGEALDGIQRCSQLVGNVVDELIFHVEGLFGFLAGRFQTFVLLLQTLDAQMMLQDHG